jgi:hypothetical protein
MEMLRFLLHKFAAALLAMMCLVPLAQAQSGSWQSFFSEAHAIEEGMAVIREKTGPSVRAFSVEITSDRIAHLAQDPGNPRRIQEWRLQTSLFPGGRDVAGPFPAQPVLINPGLEANLFNLSEVDFAAADGLIKAAAERAALDGPAYVTSIEIKRETFIVPPGSGNVLWHVHVASGGEFAEIYANARGAIRAADLTHTNRAMRLDLFQQPELAAGAGKAFQESQGAGKILLKVSIRQKDVYFETSETSQSGPIPLSGSLSWTIGYSWSPYSLCGSCLTARRGGINTGTRARLAPFGIVDLNWTAVPKIIAAAKEKLAMPDGRIAGVELNMPTAAIGAPVLVWRVDLADRTEERGWIEADRSGIVTQVHLPESRVKPADWLEPAAIMEALARAARDYGAQRQVRSIHFSRKEMTLAGEDPRAPRETVEIKLTDEGFSRSGMSPFGTGGAPFTLADLSPLSAEKIASLKAGTLARLKPLDYPIDDIYIERNGASRKGGVTIEMRAWEQGPVHRWGAVVYDIDGAVVSVMKP